MRRALLTVGAISALAASSATAVVAQDASVEDVIASLPPELGSLYENYSGTVTLAQLPELAAGEAPWKMCYSESYQGNPWRIALTNEMQRLADEFIAAGKLSEFKMSDANGDVPTQITQIQSFIDEGCDIIVTVAGSSTGLDEVIGKAAEAGIPVITNSGAVTAPSAINVDSNWWRWGYDMMDAIGQELGGTGNVVVVEGIAGSPIVAMQADGRNAALENHPGLNVVATVNGDWTPTTTKSVVLQTLATNPAEIDAVWTSGSESRLVAEAFAESGREPALTTGSISGDGIGYWKENPDGYRFTGNAVLPVPTANSAFRIAMRVLEGQGPKLNTLLVDLPKVTMDDLPGWAAECMTTDSATIFPVAPSDPYPEELLDAYFENGAATPPYDYSTTPDPCG
jgi:ribose transport system substrate-binding protein